jgi:hypothetical protein
LENTASQLGRRMTLRILDVIVAFLSAGARPASRSVSTSSSTAPTAVMTTRSPYESAFNFLQQYPKAMSATKATSSPDMAARP